MLRASLDETSTDDRSGYPLALWRVANEGREEVSEGCKKTRRHRHKRRKESKATLRKQHRAKRLSARPKTDEKDAKKGNQLEVSYLSYHVSMNERSNRIETRLGFLVHNPIHRHVHTANAPSISLNKYIFYLVGGTGCEVRNP